MIAKNKSSNLLEQSQYKYSLQDVDEPNLYRDIYPYDEIPKVAFNHRRVPIAMPNDIWITDTTFRDGQQSRAPYTAEQIETELGFNLDQCGYPHKEEEILAPMDLMQRYQEERASLNAEIDRVLAELSALLGGAVE